MNPSDVPLTTLGSLLFTLMGPIAAIPLFATHTAGADPALRLRIAFVAYGTALVTLAVAVFIGAGVLSGWGVSPPALIIAAGLILTLTALSSVLERDRGSPASPPGEPKASTGFAPIAIPGLVTPVTVGILVIFVSHFPATADKIAVMAVASAVLTINLVAMLCAHWVMRVIGPAPLVVLGAVFGVLQVAMGLQWIISGIGRLRLPL